MEASILRLTSSTGEKIELLVPGKPGVILINGVPGSIQDLKTGFRVLQVFYGLNGVVVRLEVTTP